MNELAHHKEVTKWMKRKYPKIIFRTDYSAGLKLTPGQAKMHYALQHSKGYPDLFIAHPSKHYAGLFLELKTPEAALLLKDGTISNAQHIQSQAKMLAKLRAEGYAATFAQGHQHAKMIIESYLKDEMIQPQGIVPMPAEDTIPDDLPF